ncbi:uncharacterized protein LOC114356687 [Ostrinia furnacalis]|uniref:uncharacterized protein LOC114356687 n=1 Tax=Ostrinia furnacalis TaxID=93504 RepID=UPI00103F5086|nr:uncharacterized protein LOC114356687 [Ostrinia furnacalis]
MYLLRDAACPSVIYMIYFGLCQSILGYCVSAWGGTYKTTMLKIERAQRAVLKVMLNRPRMYPTNLVYAESNVLSVRKLYVLKAVLTTHKAVLRSDTYKDLLRKRVFKIATPKISTSFAKSHSDYLYPHIYNKVVAKCDIKNHHPFETKKKIVKWLLPLQYNEVEQLLRTPV